MNKLVKHLLRKLPYIKNLSALPGHYYSPVINIEEIRRREKEIWPEPARTLVGIELREQEQLNLLESLIPFYKEIPFESNATDKTRYYFKNDMYPYTDGVYLYCLLRALKPKRIIEVGSGYSSALMLDTNDLYFNRQVELTFIEPFPNRLHSLLKENEKIRLIQTPVQEVPLPVFDELGENDILFIDSTHVSKTGSDVNFLFFQVLPRLKKGVKIHFHDIYYPFEYPKELVLGDRRSWNEAYLLRCFLTDNNKFRILAYSSFLEIFHRAWLAENMPLCLKNNGSNIWLEVC